jgi:hypothetical protein
MRALHTTSQAVLILLSEGVAATQQTVVPHNVVSGETKWGLRVIV